MRLFSNFDLYFFSVRIFLAAYFFFILINKIQKLNIISFYRNFILTVLRKFFLSLKLKRFNKVFLTYFCTLFSAVFFLNFTSVLPFNFPMTSQIRIIMLVSLTGWFSLLLFQNTFYIKRFLSHCIPEGTPIYLVSLLFIIELIRNLIRPITITVRLIANILAGHLLIILLSKIVLKLIWTSFAYFLLNTIEFFVAFIQAYIFSTMISLYYSEVN